jgi:L-amino acid N-acyltransferase YncA
MKYPNILKRAAFQLLYLYYRVTGIYRRKVLVKSIKTIVQFQGRLFPQREFYALTKRHKEMAYGKVMVGHFQEREFHYCLLTGVYVKPLYRRRGLAGKLLNARIKFCEKEGFEFILAPIEFNNINSMALHKKCGFKMVNKEDWPMWIQSEASVYNRELTFWLYEIKKPAPKEPVLN